MKGFTNLEENMKKNLIILVLLISINFLFTEIMTITTQSEDYEFDISDIEQIWFEGDVTVEEVAELLEKIPIKFLKNYPNPFNPTTTISFSTTEITDNTEINIYNLKGQKIRKYSIFNNQSSITWDGKDDNGQEVSSGIYFYNLTVPNAESVTRKMVLLK